MSHGAAADVAVADEKYRNHVNSSLKMLSFPNVINHNLCYLQSLQIFLQILRFFLLFLLLSFANLLVHLLFRIFIYKYLIKFHRTSNRLSHKHFIQFIIISFCINILQPIITFILFRKFNVNRRKSFQSIRPV